MMKSFVFLIFGIIISETCGGYGYRSLPLYGQGAPVASYQITPRYRSQLSIPGSTNLGRQFRSYPLPLLDGMFPPEAYIIGQQITGDEITCFLPGIVYAITGHLPFRLPSPDTTVYSCTEIGVRPPPMVPTNLLPGLRGYYFACPKSLNMQVPIFWTDGTIRNLCSFFYYYDSGELLEVPLLEPTPFTNVPY